MTDFLRVIHHGDCLDILPEIPRNSIRLAYIDPPFNTGHTQKRQRLKLVHDVQSKREGFGGRTYTPTKLENDAQFADKFEDYPAWLMPRIETILPTLTDDGSILIHLDYREVHYIKVAMDKLMGRDHFMNEIIWAYDYGARSKTRWPAKHDNILWYAKDPDNYVFNFDAMDRIPYMAPGLVGPEKAARGKTPTDTFFLTIVPTNGKEKTSYPTQKPMHLLNRFIRVHSNKGDTVLDAFAGSGTTGESAVIHDRNFVLIDENPTAIEVMKKRLEAYKPMVL